MIIPTGHRPTSEMNQSRRMARITVVIRPRIRGSVRFSVGLIGSRIDDTVPTDPVVITERDVAQFRPSASELVVEPNGWGIVQSSGECVH